MAQCADQIRLMMPKLATIMDEVEPGVLAYMTFSKEHRVKSRSRNRIEHLKGEIRRHT